MPFASIEALLAFYDVCIIGAGPAGLATAISLHGRGLRVLLLDAGGRHPVPGSPDVIAAHISHPDAHWPTELTAAAALGGSSHWWGGRLVPFDQADFVTWPITHQEIQPWQSSAAQLLGADEARLGPPPEAFSRLSHFQADDPERWLRVRNVSRLWNSQLRAKDGPFALLHARVTRLNMANDRIESVEFVRNGATHKVRARHFVIASGGLGSLRLLLLLQRSNPALFGGPAGPLGHGYMGHLTGSISDLVFANRSDADAFGHVPAPSHFERRRITARQETVVQRGICNIGFWVTGPDNSNPAHQSASASARYLAASFVRSASGSRVRGTGSLKSHFRNVASAPASALTGLVSTVYQLTASRATGKFYRPRRFASSGDGGWRMLYHAEQRSNPSNRITLGTDLDSIGIPKLSIDFRFSDSDVAAVVDAHELLDQDLRESGSGSLRYLDKDTDARKQRVLASAKDGFHQISGARMSASPHDGVVDPNCRAHGLDNLFVVSSCVFPTGGQANPTLMIVALACRLAAHISGELLGAGAAATQKITTAPTQMVGAT